MTPQDLIGSLFLRSWWVLNSEHKKPERQRILSDALTILPTHLTDEDADDIS